MDEALNIGSNAVKWPEWLGRKAHDIPLHTLSKPTQIPAINSVMKLGRSTGLTIGSVSAVPTLVKSSEAAVEELTVVPESNDYFAVPGDSGAFVLDETGQVFGMVHGGMFPDSKVPIEVHGPRIVFLENFEVIKQGMERELGRALGVDQFQGAGPWWLPQELLRTASSDNPVASIRMDTPEVERPDDPHLNLNDDDPYNDPWWERALPDRRINVVEDDPPIPDIEQNRYRKILDRLAQVEVKVVPVPQTLAPKTVKRQSRYRRAFPWLRRKGAR